MPVDRRAGRGAAGGLVEEADAVRAEPIYDALHYRVAIRLDLDQKAFEAEAMVSLTSLREGLEAIVLDAEEFVVSRVVSDWGEPLRFEQSAKELTVHMSRPLRLGETRSFTCSYTGKDTKIGIRSCPPPRTTGACVFYESWPTMCTAVPVLRLPERQVTTRRSSPR